MADFITMFIEQSDPKWVAPAHLSSQTQRKKQAKTPKTLEERYEHRKKYKREYYHRMKAEDAGGKIHRADPPSQYDLDRKEYMRQWHIKNRERRKAERDLIRDEINAASRAKYAIKAAQRKERKATKMTPEEKADAAKYAKAYYYANHATILQKHMAKRQERKGGNRGGKENSGHAVV